MALCFALAAVSSIGLVRLITVDEQIVVSNVVSPDSKPTCTASLQDMIEAAPPGSTVGVPGGCVYRESVTINKPLKLEGGPGAEIRGSNIWSQWTKKEARWWREGGPYWIQGTLSEFSTHGRCEPGTQRCHWPEQVFFDGEPLTQVASNPQTGQFTVDAGRNVILADDPAGHTVEVSVRRDWVVGKSAQVTIEGFVMRHAASDSQANAPISNEGYSDWTIRDNILSDSHGSVVSLREGTRLELVGNDVSHGGQLGIHASSADLTIRNNKIHDNNTEDFATGWEAGGMKAAAMSRLIAEDNEVYSNNGPGLWCDAGCRDVTFSDNRIHHNAKMGINFEISNGAIISHNKLWENGWSKDAWGWGAGIVSSSSKNVEIHDNVLAWNANGISVISQYRAKKYSRVVENVRVSDNVLVMGYRPPGEGDYSLTWLQDWKGPLFKPIWNNGGSGNLYWYPAPEGSQGRFRWGGESFDNLDEFETTPGEESGRYLRDKERETMLSSSDVPNSAEPR